MRQRICETKKGSGAHRYIQHQAFCGRSGISVGIYKETNERKVSDWVAGGWVLLQRVFERNKRIKMGLV